MENQNYPQKTREFYNHHFDSSIWNDFKFRDDDIIISTYAKSGTTWMQQIIAQLLFNGEEGLEVSEMSPWMDLRVPPKEIKLAEVELQKHRRFVKTHLPVDALVFSEKAKYIYIGRDGRDVVWSLYNHHINANEKWYDALNNSPGLIGPPIDKPTDDVAEYFRDWLDKDGFPFWSFWDNLRTWWSIKDLPNVHFVHFENLKNDMSGEIKKIAAFLEIEINESKWNKILEHCSFDYMKKHSSKSVPLGGIFWDGGSETFINKGVNGRWKEILTKEDNEKYVNMCKEKLGDACTKWLNTGEL
ncbi:MAG: sulfotransferase domain-containing protein [Saprospirales bacterium]|nr:sulfotransferase domain-containing protein [Saprospirales bacterium]